MIYFPVLFVRADSRYKCFDGFDLYDALRDALSVSSQLPVIAHPPCRAWGRLSHMSRPAAGERDLALWAVDKVRKNGGVLEHPLGSKIWRAKNLPFVGGFPDSHGGFCISINQYDFGHVASKPTILYIVGCKISDLPKLPIPRNSKPLASITGQVQNTRRCTQYEREYTPDLLILWLRSVLLIIQSGKTQQLRAVNGLG